MYKNQLRKNKVKNQILEKIRWKSSDQPEKIYSAIKKDYDFNDANFYNLVAEELIYEKYIIHELKAFENKNFEVAYVITNKGTVCINSGGLPATYRGLFKSWIGKNLASFIAIIISIISLLIAYS